MNFRSHGSRLTPLLLVGFALLPFVHAEAQTVESHFDSTKGTRSWMLPYAYSQGEEADHTFYPNPAIDFTSALAMRFTPQIRGTLSNVHVYVEDVSSSQPDSVVRYGVIQSGGNATSTLRFPSTSQSESITGFAQRITAPFSGSLESVRIDLDGIGSADGGNDVLEVGFYNRDLARAQEVSYWQPGTVWLFGVPNGSGSITGYGTRITAPSAQSDSVTLQGVDVYVFRINDDRFFTGYDTPANDTLLVGIHTSAGANGKPDELRHSVKVPFTRIREGYSNRINLQDLRWPQGQDLVVTLETLANGNRDYLGLISGTSLNPPINRSIVKENGNWVTISSSTSWGSGSAKGAEIRITGVFEDANAKTPDTQSPKRPPLRLNVSDLSQGENTIPVDGLSLFNGEELWVTFQLQTAGTPDTLTFNAAEPTSASQQARVAARLTQTGRTTTHSWSYLPNTVTHQGVDLNLTLSSQFNGQVNDRLMLSLYTDEAFSSRPDQKIRDLEVPLYTLLKGQRNVIDVSEWAYETDPTKPFHISMSTNPIGDTDGIVLRSDQGDVIRGQSRSSAFSTRAGRWDALPDRGAEAGATAHFDWGIEVAVSTSTQGTPGDSEHLPTGFSLESVYPNPFNPSTMIRFRVASQQTVRLEVLDVLGRRIALLIDDRLYSAGDHSISWNADGLGSGVYVLRMVSAGAMDTQVVTLMR